MIFVICVDRLYIHVISKLKHFPEQVDTNNNRIQNMNPNIIFLLNK